MNTPPGGHDSRPLTKYTGFLLQGSSLPVPALHIHTRVPLAACSPRHSPHVHTRAHGRPPSPLVIHGGSSSKRRLSKLRRWAGEAAAYTRSARVKTRASRTTTALGIRARHHGWEPHVPHLPLHTPWSALCHRGDKLTLGTFVQRLWNHKGDIGTAQPELMQPAPTHIGFSQPACSGDNTHQPRPWELQPKSGSPN